VVIAGLYTVFVWWFSTGVILYLNGMPRQTFKFTMAGATVVLVAALYALFVTSQITQVWAAYCAFTSAVLVWAWQEIGFLLGMVTGSRRDACPEGARGWRRARYAFQAVSHHELALVVLGAGVWLVTRGGENQVGFYTFLILWAMRQSAKLNVFLGVRNLNEDFLPKHLKYLQTYFTRRPMNALLPVSIVLSTVVAVPIWQAVFAADAGSFDQVGLALLATLLSLAIAEHFFLVLPIPFEALWKWGLRSRTINHY
jgi:putative photosynthetic complex assembly protein 2